MFRCSLQREKLSYNIAKNIFGEDVKIHLIPDIVLSSKEYNLNNIRSGIGICLKSCKESILSEGDKRDIQNIFANQKMDIRHTSMHSQETIYLNNRRQYIEAKLDELSRYKLVITDALHCMILCAITKTPCIAINNISKKLEGTYQWIREISYIRFSNSKEDIDKLADELLNNHSLYNDSYCFNYSDYTKKIMSIIKE